MRELLAEAKREQERDQARGERLRALVRAGRLVGMGAAQLAEASGLSRAGVYEVQKRAAAGPVDGFDEILLAALAGGAGAPEALASSLGVGIGHVHESLERLRGEDAIKYALAGYDDASQQAFVLLTAGGEARLQDMLRRAISARPELWVAYLQVAQDEASRLHDAAVTGYGRQNVALLESTVRGDMTGPELAIAFDVGDVVELFNVAGRAWSQLCAEAGLPLRPAQFAAYSAPRLRTGTLEAFARGIADANQSLERQVMRRAADAPPGLEEKAIAVHALTAAASALRGFLGQPKRPPTLMDGERAFDELQIVAGLALDSVGEAIRQPLLRALELATDRLGPFPGGQLGSVRAAGQPIPVVEEVEPTFVDLVEIARASGEAVGCADGTPQGQISALEVLDAVVHHARAEPATSRGRGLN